MEKLIEKSLFNSCNYSEFKVILSDLLFEGKSTGSEQSEDLLQYSTLNEIRLRRLDKTLVVPDEIKEKLKSFEKEYTWLVIAEGWCGDAAQILPILNKMALETDKIDLRIVFRDSNDELMNKYLTNGARAIPKLLIIDKEAGVVCNHWGPRPQGATDLIKNYKAEFGVVNEEAKTQLQLWYLHDKGLSVQNEVVEMMFASVEECVCM
ncbi:thioredoxin family protein [Flavobacterium gilvum]|uniref:Thioredoxin family protein n=1 Tax=Flavobacterium gilvum TaxID=1492737 RepID=A0AAC9I2J0_9FLAO|nr:thioredoxin family protein [Flavobacterium gilvum]AOW09034.1 thioredoxin family protein [Flavobacterium gilvum]KFC60581.1 thioredoxin [Flavobacterium gilvum]